MSDLLTITTLRRTALEALTALHSLSSHVPPAVDETSVRSLRGGRDS